MKEAKVIHINDGTSVELTNGNRHFAEEQSWAGNMLTMYLNAGYDIIGIIPDLTPSYEGEGGYNFYKTGFTAVMTREVTEDCIIITKEDWENANTELTYEDYESIFSEEFTYEDELPGFDFYDEELDVEF